MIERREVEDLAREWKRLTTRLAGISDRECVKRGFAIISVDILVHPNGEPVLWTEPKVTKLEPRLGGYEFLSKVIELLGNGKHPEQHMDKSKD